MQDEQEDKVYYDFSFKSVNDNLFRVFGTYKLFRIMSPSMRNVPFTGIEWAFLMQDLGYNQNGIKYLTDVEMSTSKFEPTSLVDDFI